MPRHQNPLPDLVTPGALYVGSLAGPISLTPGAPNQILRVAPGGGLLQWVDPDDQIIGYIGSEYYNAAAVNAMLAAVVDSVEQVMPQFPMVSGRYYSTITHGIGRGGTSAGSALVANRLVWVPFYMPVDRTINEVVIPVTAGVAASHIRVGYANFDLVNLTSSGTIELGVVDSIAVSNYPVTVNLPLTQGLHWWVLQSDSTPSVLSVANPSTGVASASSGAVQACPVNTAASYGPLVNGASNNFQTSVPVIPFRIA